MLSRSIRVANVRTLTHPFLIRTFTSTHVIRQPDPIQELYLRELRNYKPILPSPDEAEAQTKTWSPPRPPKIPDISAAPAEEIQQYAAEQVSVTPRAGEEKFEHDFDDLFESWFDEPESERIAREEDSSYEKKQRRIFPPPPPRPEKYKGRPQRSRTGSD